MPNKLNICRLLAPDFTIGKIIVLRKSIADIIRLLIKQPTAESLRLARLLLKLKPQYTMVTNKNLLTLYRIVQEVNQLGLPGDIVECGVWNGGSAAMMAVADMENTRAPETRTIWLFDSFQGLPPAGEKDGELERNNYFQGWNKGDVSKVKAIFRKLEVPLSSVQIIPGWFDVTLKTPGVERIAVLHIDADWYESVRTTLNVLYDKIVPGGFVIFNDYGAWQGCKRAVDEFFAERNLNNVTISQIDISGGAYAQKPKPGTFISRKPPI